MALGHFVWYALRTAKPAESQAFLERVFGWTVETHQTGGFSLKLIKQGEATLGSILGIDTPGRGLSRWMGALSVAQVEPAAAAVESKGGMILVPPQDIPGFGRYCTVRDPQGAVLALFAGEVRNPTTRRDRPGYWAWNELMARDDAAAVAFYTGALGFGHRPQPLGPNRTYHVMLASNAPSCGIIRTPAPTFPTMWVPYVTVADCDAATATAKAAGARILGVPRTAAIGRYSVLLDPANAPMGLMQFAARR